jgi:Fe2+ transport system protein B
VNKVLIGNKSDWTDKRAVSEEEGRELAEELGVKFIETSAKINEGVEEAFFTLARCVNPRFLDFFPHVSNAALSHLAISRRALLIHRPMLRMLLPPRHPILSRLTNRLLYKLRAAAHRFSHCKPSSVPTFLLYIMRHVLSPIV